MCDNSGPIEVTVARGCVVTVEPYAGELGYRFRGANGATWQPGASLPEHATDALRIVAFRSAAWMNASTYSLDRWAYRWRTWLDRANALEHAEDEQLRMAVGS